MSITSIPKPLSGKELESKMNEVREDRGYIAEGFLYEKSIMMITSQPGVGKSVISTQALAQLSSGEDLFGYLKVLRPMKIYYIVLERDKDEVLERLKCMNGEVNINFDNICLDDEIKGVNLTKDEDCKKLLYRIKTYSPDVDIVILDPIYAGVVGGLSKDEPSSMFCRSITYLQHHLKCTMWLNHHEHRAKYTSKDGSQVDEDDSFYGSQWIKALVTASYSLKYIDSGSVLTRKKDSHGNLLSTIPLRFDYETYISSFDTSHSDIPKTDQLMMFLKSNKKLDKMVTFSQMKDYLGVSTSYLRKILSTHHFKKIFKKHKSNGRETLYEALDAK